MSLSNSQTSLLAALSAHVAWVIAATFVAIAFGFPWWYGTVGILAVAVVKETLIDPVMEGNPFWNGTWDSGAGDLAGYALGLVLTLFLLFPTYRLPLM